VVYGDDLYALTTLNLAMNTVPAERLQWVVPGALPPRCLRLDGESDGSSDSAGVVAERVAEAVAAAGVKVRTGTTLVSVTDHGDGTARVVMESGEGGEVQLDARVVLAADRRDVGRRFFAAANDAGLVYDGRLVVDHNFCTAEPSVFAAGTVVKYSRRYRAPHLHERYNSVEVGAVLGQTLLRVVDPLADPEAIGGSLEAMHEDAALARGPTFLPTMSRPKSVYARLPGRLYYLHGRLPDVDMGKSGEEMVTDIVGEDGKPQFLRLTIDRYGRLARLVYLGTQPVECRNLLSIVGRHVSLLNGLSRDFKDKHITDLVTFLRGDWATALYHDRFDALAAEIAEGLQRDPAIASLLSSVKDAAGGGAGDILLSKKRADASGAGGSNLPPSTKRSIETQLIEFLRSNRGSLPMYYLPGFPLGPTVVLRQPSQPST
jgi:hypothetical protein